MAQFNMGHHSLASTQSNHLLLPDLLNFTVVKFHFVFQGNTTLLKKKKNDPALFQFSSLAITKLVLV